MIVVTGATGRVGRHLAGELAARGQPMRLVTREPARAPRAIGAEVVAAEYGDAGALERALQEGDRVFMVSLHDGPERRVPLHQAFIESAARRRVGLVVYLSFVNAGPDATFLHARSHGATEAMLRESGLPWIAVRNGMYADEIPGWFDAEGVNRVPGGTGRMSFSYRPELARVLATLLTQPGQAGRVVDITTPESVTMAELAGIATRVTGVAYRAEPWPDERWAARWRGREAWRIEAGLSSYAALRAGEFDVVSGDYQAITGEPPAGIAEIIGRLADRMPLG